MLRHQYGQDAFVELSAPEQPVVDVEPSPVIAVDADAVAPLPVVEDVAPSAGKKR